MILMKYRVMSVVAVCALALAGCTSTAPASGKVSVVAGLYPYAWLAQEIGADLVDVTNLTPPGAEPHDLELTAKQVASVASADLAIYEAGLQPTVDAAIAQADLVHALDVTSVVPLEYHDIDLHDDDDADHDDEGLTLDPHIWLDPSKMVTVARAIADQLIKIDPSHEQAYTDSLAKLTSTLTSIDTQYITGLAFCERSDFLTTHAAFAYLAERYGLTQISISGLSPDAEPSPDRIAEIHTIAQAKGLTTVFFETLTSPALAQSIANDLGMVTDVLDPIEGITDDSRGNDYTEIMTSNLTALREANGCR